MPALCALPACRLLCTLDPCVSPPLGRTLIQNHYDVLNCKNLGCFQQLSPADGHGPMHVQVTAISTPTTTSTHTHLPPPSRPALPSLPLTIIARPLSPSYIYTPLTSPLYVCCHPYLPHVVQIGGMWGGCVDGYYAFVEKWDHVLRKNMTDAEVLEAGYKKWKWGNTEVGQLMLETAIMGEYFHIYRSFWRSHMCAVDGKPKFLTCPEVCGPEVPFEECICKVGESAIQPTYHTPSVRHRPPPCSPAPDPAAAPPPLTLTQVDSMETGETNWQNLWPCVLNSQENRDFFTSVMPDEMLADMTYWLTTASVMEGEMIESASTADPLFWLTHPVIERLLAAKRLPGVTNMGDHAQFDNWPVYNGNNETWLEFSYYTFGLGENLGFPDMAYRCVGHADYDPVLPAELTYTEAVNRFIDRYGTGTVMGMGVQ